MRNEAKTQKPETMNWPRLLPDWRRTVVPPVLAAFEQQCDLLKEHHENMMKWARRRQEAMDEGVRAMQTMLEEKDPNARLKVYNDWLNNAAKRFLDEVSLGRDEFSRFVQSGQQSAMAFWPGYAGKKTPESSKPAADKAEAEKESVNIRAA